MKSNLPTTPHSPLPTNPDSRLPTPNSGLRTPYSFLLILLISTLTISAQSFQWAKRGGSTNTLQRGQDYNNVIDMVTDEADNVYLLCRVGANNLQVDGHSVRAYAEVGIGAFPDMLLTSFTKEGQYRWSKVIGGGLNNGLGLKVKNGLVYVSGHIWANDSAYFDNDSLYYHAYNGYWPKLAFLAQYDTTGSFNWLQMPGAEDSVLFSSPAKPETGYWIDVAPNGDVYWLCNLVPGCLPNTAQPVTQEGTYVLRYNSSGQFLDRVKLDIEHGRQFVFNGIFNEGNFLRDHQSGRYYLGGQCDNNPFSRNDTLLIGGDTIKGRMYLAVFDNAGQVLLKKESVGNSGFSNFTDFNLDSSGNLFLTGSSADGEIIFNNLTFNSPEYSQAPFLLKLDPGGNTLWSKFGVAKGITPSSNLIVANNQVAISGYHFNLNFQGPNDLDTLKAVPNQGYDAFIARFDVQTGDLLGMESAKTPFGGASFGYSITADSEGSYYVGGNFDQQLFLGPDTLYKIGSQRSFFVAKYACGIPEADFTITNDSLGYYFTYTGTPADSVLWDFGDGSAPYKGDSVSHTYSAKGQYIICATAYDDCGDTSSCDTVDVQVVSLEEYRQQLFSLAPNPANDVVQIILEEPINGQASVEVFDLRGKRVAATEFASQVNPTLYTDRWKPGMYMVVLKVDSEIQDFRRLVIQK